ncbi:hypothetical protein KC19_VG007400 [Ceratodon purpureus]|uniref:Uncharacterized protein n=1 Tax=Ceratodon purpureus TaxID=3225 RepID=A0A8T0HKR2_CERPU|nr:hypothetical protein KC19_VG007400 [Ceratodon purpureus]KAG0571383.1 hypothetical protein KC19_VG007400 [Ceratodon purpureus]
MQSSTRVASTEEDINVPVIGMNVIPDQTVETTTVTVSAAAAAESHRRLTGNEVSITYEREELDDDTTLAIMFSSPKCDKGNFEEIMVSDVNVYRSRDPLHQVFQCVDVAEHGVAVKASQTDEEDAEMYEKPKCRASFYIIDRTSSTKADGEKDNNAVKTSRVDALPVRPLLARLNEEQRTFTPLQRWEYENGFPVAGVTDTRERARSVGLAPDTDDPAVQPKRRKVQCATDPPKYSFHEPVNILSGDGEEINSPKSPMPSCNGDSSKQVSRKGKEKEE